MAYRIAETLASTDGAGNAEARMERLRAVDKYPSHLLSPDGGTRQMRRDFAENPERPEGPAFTGGGPEHSR
jgi:hypothetical protein